MPERSAGVTARGELLLDVRGVFPIGSTFRVLCQVLRVRLERPSEGGARSGMTALTFARSRCGGAGECLLAVADVGERLGYVGPADAVLRVGKTRTRMAVRKICKRKAVPASKTQTLSY